MNQRHQSLGLLDLLSLFILVLASVAAGYHIGQQEAAPVRCGTDTECMQMHGGDGGPEPQ